MSMHFVTLRDESNQDGPDMVVIDRHLYLTEDRTRVVEEGDPDGRWLWASPGTPMPRGEARRLGAIPPDPEPEAEVAVVAETGTDPLDAEKGGEVSEVEGEKSPADDKTADEEPADKPKRGKPGANKARKPSEDK